MLKLKVKSLKIPMFLGVYEEEQQKQTEVMFDITLFFHSKKIFSSNSLNDTINYDGLIGKLTSKLTGSKFLLIETLLNHIFLLLKDEKLYKRIDVSIYKFNTHNNIAYVCVSKRFYKNLFIKFLYFIRFLN